jgi:hypothetical protein
MHARETSDRASSVPGMPAGPGAGGPVTGSGVAARCWQVTRDDTGGSRGGLADLPRDPGARSDECGGAGTDAAAEARLRVLACDRLDMLVSPRHGAAEVGTWAEAMLRGTTMGRAVVLPGGEQSQKV